MNERERIELLMKCYELSPSQFAEKTGIQRASVSHIVSGRNKPSLEVMLKIYDAFPELDLKWLMTGVGEEPIASSHRQDAVVETMENSLFYQPERVEQPSVQPVVQPSQEPVQVQSRPQRLPSIQQQVKAAQERPQRRTASAKAPQSNVAERRIKEIRIFYTDGTYETMFPEK